MSARASAISRAVKGVSSDFKRMCERNCQEKGVSDNPGMKNNCYLTILE